MKIVTSEGCPICAVVVTALLACLWFFLPPPSYESRNAYELEQAEKVCKELGSWFAVVRAPDVTVPGRILSMCESVHQYPRWLGK